MAGGDTSPPHNSWQPGQRRPPSCRRRSTRSRDRRRRRCRRSCRLCLCSSCYCGEGGSSAAAGSARGAGSGGVGNQRWPVCEHLHLQPLRMSPCPRSYSGWGTRRPARRRHGSAGLRRGQRHPRQRRSQTQPWPRSGRPGERSSGFCIHTIHAPGSSYHQRCRLGDDWEAGAEGGVDPGGPEHFASPGFDAERCKVPLTLSAAGGSPSRGTPGRAGCGLERSLKPSPPPSLEMVVGGEWYARGSAPSELSGFPPCLSHLATRARLPNPRELSQGTLTRRRRKAECIEVKQSRHKINWDIPYITLSES